MKKILAFIMASLMLISFVSCSVKPGENDGPESNTDTEKAPVPDLPDYTFTVEENISTVHETEDGRRSMKILRYAQLDGMENKEIQAKVNDTLRQIAEIQYSYNVPDEDILIMEDNDFSYEVDNVEVTCLFGDFISVKNTVYFMSAMSSYPSSPVYTVNIDLITGEVVDETDIFENFNIISSKFIAGDFTQVYGIENLLNETSYEDMILQYKSSYETYPDVYFSEDGLVLCIDLADSLGSSAGFEISVDEVKEALKLIPMQ